MRAAVLPALRPGGLLPCSEGLQRDFFQEKMIGNGRKGFYSYSHLCYDIDQGNVYGFLFWKAIVISWLNAIKSRSELNF